MGYRSDNFVSNQRLHREIESRPITNIVCQRQLWLAYMHGQVPRFQKTDPTHRVLPVGDDPGWKRPRGLRLKQVNAPCKYHNMGRAGGGRGRGGELGDSPLKAYAPVFN